MKLTENKKLNLINNICVCKIPEPRTVVKRVAGGWLYSQQIRECNLYEVVFVPYNNEFQRVLK